ncbi:MAG TPA: transketolase [Candidatus Acidoferrales bacterium]|nr:transketolase [Candidatus Acidoferrales bacterium]
MTQEMQRPTQSKPIDQLSIHTIRFLSLDMVEKAQSGHPGTPMGAADMAYVLWNKFLKHNPTNPNWPNRDRFVLSPGHASAMLYSLLYLTGYDLPLEELKNFREWGSKTPGHPEYGRTPGVAATTGPLGQGFANGVGMAMAERFLADHFNRPHHEIINHYTYAIASDGDMQEGVTSEAASLAGTLRLGKLIYLYDSNEVQIEGPTKQAFRENVGRRFDAYGWQVIGPIDGTDLPEIERAILRAKDETEKPSLIICKTIIGHCTPEEGTAKIHGEPIPELDARRAKELCKWPTDRTFYVPDDVLAHMREAVKRGESAEREWQQGFEEYGKDFPELASRFKAQMEGKLPADWDSGLQSLFQNETKPIATRSASGKVLNILAKHVHGLTGGSGDLNPSTKTFLVGYGNFGWQEHYGHNIHFGVREHAMGAITNGMALHHGVIPYAATFLIFSDYMRPPIRLAAMMKIRVVYVFTHDSIGLGQDGPTHQPIEQLMGLRSIPNMTVIRPSDATETVEAWRAALLNTHGPTALILTRQDLPIIDRSKYASAANLHRGAYVLWETEKKSADIILIGTGSEVQVALEAGKKLASEGTSVRVVSMPSWELFDSQPADYKESILPRTARLRVSVEAAAKVGWEHYVGLDGKIIGLDHFGASAPGEVLFEKFHITSEHVVTVAKELLRELRERN